MAYRGWSDGEVGADYHRAEAVQPERRLMRAVLEDGIRTLHIVRLTGNERLVAERVQRLFDAPQVSSAVVDDDEVIH